MNGMNGNIMHLSHAISPPGMDSGNSYHNDHGNQRRDSAEDDQSEQHGDQNNDDWLTHLRDWAVLPDKCVAIQKSLKRATAAEIDYCFNALSPNLVTFARDQVGNHTLQSLLKHCTSEQLAQALPLLFQVETIVELSCDQFSNHVLQQYLQQAPAELLIQAVEVIYANRHSLLKMACDRIGNHVIQCCVKVSPSNLDEMTSVLADKDILPQLSQHHFGNHVLRCVIENELTDKLRASLWNHWDKLSFDKYGNLCIQKFISKIPAEDLEIHAHELAQRLTQLATHRFANHVLQSYVDQAVHHSNAQTVAIIVNAMKKGFFELATDQFGSFVVCTALAAFEDEASTPLVDFCVQGSNICKIARTQYGCQLLQKWIDVASEIQLKRISIALSSCFAAVSRDKFGNHFCLKMMSSRAASVINRDEGTKGLSQLIMNVATLAEHQHASHVVQRIVELQVWSQLSDDTRTDIAAAIGKNLPRLARHKLGVHVARKAFSVVFGGSDGSSEKKSASKLLQALGSCFLQVALDQHGCRLFEACIRCGQDDLTELLVSQCCTNINRLSRHTFGGLSVRAVLNGCKGSPGVRETILQRICDALAPHSVSLARDRQGNLVLQAAIRATKTAESSKALAEALMPHSVPLCLDWFGNRVVQRLLECLSRDSEIFLQLTNRIETHKDELEESKYGKFVLSTIEKGEFPAVGPDYEEIQAREDMLMMGLPAELQGIDLDDKPPWAMSLSSEMLGDHSNSRNGRGGGGRGKNRNNSRGGGRGGDRNNSRDRYGGGRGGKGDRRDGRRVAAT